MKKVISIILLFSFLASAKSSEILLSKSINSEYAEKIKSDLILLDGFPFKKNASSDRVRVMQLNDINSESVSRWLNTRVHSIVQESAQSFFNLYLLQIISLQKNEVEYPNSDIIPFSMTNPLSNNESDQTESDLSNKELTLMSNLSANIYILGKSKKELYSVKISRGQLKKPYNVKVISPRSGIIQIGDGLFDPEFTVNPENPEAISNSILRLATLFHEARHSDGNGLSLGFTHAFCPPGHDYEGSAACDENLNGPYTIGKLMLTEMSNSCEECSERDKQLFKLIVLDNANRILKTTHTNEVSTDWDETPETL